MDQVQVLLMFTAATRTCNWRLHLAKMEELLPYFHAHDEPVQLWTMGPLYVADMLELQSTHPKTWKFLDYKIFYYKTQCSFHCDWSRPRCWTGAQEDEGQRRVHWHHSQRVCLEIVLHYSPYTMLNCSGIQRLCWNRNTAAKFSSPWTCWSKGYSDHFKCSKCCQGSYQTGNPFVQSCNIYRYCYTWQCAKNIENWGERHWRNLSLLGWWKNQSTSGMLKRRTTGLTSRM